MPRATKINPGPPADTLFDCGYPSVFGHLATVQPDRLISILGPHDDADWPTVTGIPHLRVEVDDVHATCTVFHHATKDRIRQLVDLRRHWRPPSAPAAAK